MGTEKKCKCECGDTKPLSEAEKCAAELRKLMKDKEGEEKCALCMAVKQIELMDKTIDMMTKDLTAKKKLCGLCSRPLYDPESDITDTGFYITEYLFNPYD